MRIRWFSVALCLCVWVSCDVARLDMEGFPCRETSQCRGLVCHKAQGVAVGRCGQEGALDEVAGEPQVEPRESKEDSGVEGGPAELRVEPLADEPSQRDEPTSADESVSVDEPTSPDEAYVEPEPPCTSGGTRRCYPQAQRSSAGVGPCTWGNQSCVGGQWEACTGFVLPKPEVCDGKDHNCDGKSDCVWTQTLGGTKDEFPAHAMVRDSQGHVYLAGSFVAPLQLGATLLSPGTGKSVFLAKLSPTGKVLWATSFPSQRSATSGPLITSMVLDPKGALYLTGVFSEEVSFGSIKLRSDGARSDAFVLKFDTSSAKVQWAIRFGGSEYDEGTSIALMSNGDVLVAGLFRKLLTLGAKTYQNTGVWADTFMTRLAAKDGKVLWSTVFHGRGWISPSVGRGLFVDTQDRITIGGFFNRYDMNVGQHKLVYPHAENTEKWAGFLIQLDAKGQYLWHHTLTGTDVLAVHAVRGLPDGSLYVGGYFHGTASILGGSLQSAFATSADGFVLKCDSKGKLIWLSRMGGTASEWVVDLVPAPKDGVFVTGFFQSTAMFGSKSHQSYGGNDSFVVRFDDKGKITWSLSGGSIHHDSTRAILLAEPGYGLALGYFRGTANIGGDTLVSKGAADLFLWKWQYP